MKGDSIQTETCSVCLPSNKAQAESARSFKGKGWGRRLRKETHVFYLIFRHPRTPWYARLVAACAAGYLLSPIQLIPNFIPVIGVLDDVVVILVGLKLIRRMTPADVLFECHDRANAAELRRKEEARWVSAVVVPIMITTVWVLAAIGASALLAAYIYR